MKRKGFTLIELLAVIVILAIIALVTVPMIMDTIEKARKQAFLDSAYGIVEAGEYFYAKHILNQEEVEPRYDFEVKDKKFVYSKDNTQTLSFKGDVPKTGILQLNSNGKTALAICNDTYCACKSISELQVTIKEENCGINTETGEIENGSGITSKELEELKHEIEQLKKNEYVVPGTVISYMSGSSAPKGYLSCDGSIYNISEYPNLAESIKNGFGNYNYYGGDGTTTFAVPDLRGEFLRGTGTASRNTGSGNAVGVHQDATKHVNVLQHREGSQTFIYTPGDYEYRATMNTDLLLNVNKNGFNYVNTIHVNNNDVRVPYYTSRPTNTSVLYCIKY